MRNAQRQRYAGQCANLIFHLAKNVLKETGGTAKLGAEDINEQIDSNQSESIRVDSKKIDRLINMVGELVLTQSTLGMLSEQFDVNQLDQLQNGLSQMQQYSRELQESIINIRMLPISLIFSRCPRFLHASAQQHGKHVKLSIRGDHHEVDKLAIELLSTPLMNLIQYCVANNIESPQQRQSLGKADTATVSLNAFHRGNDLVIEISDDGKGFDLAKIDQQAKKLKIIEHGMTLDDRQIYELICMAGEDDPVDGLNDNSRCLRSIQKTINMLDGSIGVNSRLGQSSTFTIRLPLFMTVLEGQCIAVADEKFVVPANLVIDSINLAAAYNHTEITKSGYFQFCGESIPVINLQKLFEIDAIGSEMNGCFIIIVEEQGIRYGLLVDTLLDRRQIVFKAIDANYRNIEGLSGATIFADGSVALILDIPGLFRLAGKDKINSL